MNTTPQPRTCRSQTIQRLSPTPSKERESDFRRHSLPRVSMTTLRRRFDQSSIHIENSALKSSMSICLTHATPSPFITSSPRLKLRQTSRVLTACVTDFARKMLLNCAKCIAERENKVLDQKSNAASCSGLTFCRPVTTTRTIGKHNKYGL